MTTFFMNVATFTPERLVEKKLESNEQYIDIQPRLNAEEFDLLGCLALRVSVESQRD